MSEAQGEMQELGELDGQLCFWAEPGRFTEPGFYFWDGVRNVRVPLLHGIHLERRTNGEITVAIEVNKQWVTVISESVG